MSKRYVYYKFYANGIGCGGADIVYLRFNSNESLEYIEDVYKDWLNDVTDINLVSETFFKEISEDEAVTNGVDNDFA